MSQLMMQIGQYISGKSEIYQKVAKYIIENQNQVIFMTLDVLATKIGVSTTTVLRFTRTLGFSGYKDFQEQLRTDIMNVVSSYSSYAKLGQHKEIKDKGTLLNQVLKCEHKNIQSTLESLNLEMVKMVVDLFWNTKGHILCSGFGSSYALAYYLYSRLVPLRKNITLLHQDAAELADTLIDFNSDDICFYFIFHRYNKRSKQILEELHSKGVRIILITDYPHQTIENYGEFLFPCCDDNLAPKNYMAGTISLIDYLFTAIVFERRTEALARYAEANRLYSKYQITEE